MKTGDDKYNMIVDLLRSSTPEPGSKDNIEREVISRIRKLENRKINHDVIVGFLFGWVNIGWVRRSLIIASVSLVMIFIYQQGMILKRIDKLSNQTINIESAGIHGYNDDVERLMTTYKNTGLRLQVNSIKISDKQLKELIESFDELQMKYKNLQDVINNDPQLKKLIENKLKENESKINL